MLTGGMRSAAGGHRAELYRWKRTEKGGSKPAFDYDNVEHWIKRVEQASEFAVSEVFSPKKPAQRGQRGPRPTLDLTSTDQLHDHDDAYTEAQELLSEWLSNKLRLELASEEDEDSGIISAEPPKPPAPEFIKYNKFDDLYQHLEQETDDSNTQDFLQQLLQKEVVNSGILENLRSADGERPSKRRDPRVTMEARHQQVKENRAQRQKQMEKQKQERAVKKAALSQAQLLLQEENKHKALKVKKEEEEIQKEMVKLRKEMTERRTVMEEARRMEWKRQQSESKKKQEVLQAPPSLRGPESDRSRREKEARIQELLSQVYAANRKCLQTCFSAWYKLVLERRVKLGKARALADWKLQLKVFRAWKQLVWSQKMERESQKMEMELRDQNRKQQVAVESYHKRLLRHCFMEWQLWCRAEKEKRELDARKEETKRKMAALLEVASSQGGARKSSEGGREATVRGPETTQQKAADTSSVVSASHTPLPVHKNSPAPRTPKYAWQVTRQHAALTPEEMEQHRLQTTSTPQTPAPQRKGPAYGENFENRHQFQQQMIDEQRRQLKEQKEMIQELLENQRLMIVRKEAKNATAATAQLSGQLPAPNVTYRKDSDPSVDQYSPATHEVPRRLSFSSSQAEHPNHSPGQSTVSSARRPSRSTASPHPAVRAMEERAAQRAERKRLLEEVKRKREEDKLAQLRAAEEQRLEMEAAEREAQLERKREERRQQKLREEERQQRLQREKELQEKAVIHYDRTLLRSRGLEPWKRLMTQSRHNMERAESHHHSALLRGVLRVWLHTAQENIAEKNRQAERLWATILLRRTFHRWLKYKDCLFIQEQRAQRHHKAVLQRKTFTAWLDVTQEEKISMWEKQRAAGDHNQRRILSTAFRTWRCFPAELKEQRQKEERREMLRKKVSEILPDFQGGGGENPKS
ncbi:coiled-coil domain-containing protein 191 [Hyperolius riggenbachi]|uniref:coiled-coil domain-containing protein 191 n=1 Tax=Hyperolius riggenbachi TaxID=752182 RepID=UPI0035A272D1